MGIPAAQSGRRAIDANGLHSSATTDFGSLKDPETDGETRNIIQLSLETSSVARGFAIGIRLTRKVSLVLLADTLNGKHLAKATNGPWRLVVPSGAAYQSIKAVDHLLVPSHNHQTPPVPLPSTALVRNITPNGFSSLPGLNRYSLSVS